MELLQLMLGLFAIIFLFALCAVKSSKDGDVFNFFSFLALIASGILLILDLIVIAIVKWFF